MNIAGVHLDRRETLPHAQEIEQAVRSSGREALFFNANAADDARRAEVLEGVAGHFQKLGQPGRIHLLFHSLAFGTLRPFVTGKPEEWVTRKQVEMTLDVMANSLLFWVQDLRSRGMLQKGARVFAMTSAGSARVWASYGPVSAAKAALESHVRQLSLELAPEGITVNAIRAGVTDTPSLRKIPGHEEMIKTATERNPGKRMTTPEDVAKALVVLAQEGVQWMTGNVIGVDGGEFNV
jgi:NAD(P)-dependent dehydrogenase (short-subunit alcohol dehydrogenase family)